MIQTTNQLLDAAIAYAAWGWPVLPIRPRAKLPLTPHGVRDASTDPAVIAAWWQRWPDANVAIATGAPGPDVIDLDAGRGGVEAWQRLLEEHHGQGAAYATVSTGGGGLHIYFAGGRCSNTKDRLGPGIETSGSGRYVLAPPSIHPSGRAYAWMGHPDETGLQPMPDWMIAGGNLAGMVDGSARPIGERRERPEAYERCRMYMDHLEPAISGQGGHKATLRAACECARFGLSEAETWDLLCSFNARCIPPWSEKELRHKLREGRKLVGSEFGRKLDEGTVETATDPVPRISEPEPEPPNAWPADLLDPPGVVGEICRWVVQTAYKPQPELALANTLAFWGAVVGRKVRTTSDLRTNLYSLGVGESGCGKDHSRKAIKRICAAAGIAGDILGGEEIASDAAIMLAAANHRSVLFQLDEIGHMLGVANSKYAAAHMRNIAPTFMRLFSSANTLIVGKEYRGAERRDLDQPNVCLYGTTVPGRLFGGLTPAEVSDGFLGRMLVFQSVNPDPPAIERPIADVPESIRIAVESWWQRNDMPKAHSGNLAGQVPITVPMDADATAIMAKFSDECSAAARGARDGNGLDALWQRAPEHAKKVALVIAAGCDFQQPTITPQISNFSVSLVGHVTRLLLGAVRDNVTDSDFGRAIQRVQRIIREAGRRGISRRDLTRTTQGMARRTREDALQELSESGKIASVERQGERGRPALRYISSNYVISPN